MSTFVYVTHVSEGTRTGDVYSKVKRVNLDRVDAIEEIENTHTGAQARLIWPNRDPWDVRESAIDILSEVPA